MGGDMAGNRNIDRFRQNAVAARQQNLGQQRQAQQTGGDEEDLRRRYYDRLKTSEGDADRLMQEYTQSAGAGDPRAAFRESSQAAFDTFKEQFSDNLSDLRGQQVGQGRLNTGFRFDDEDRLFKGMGENLNRTISDRALDAERLVQNQTAQRAGMAQWAGDRATAGVGGEYHTLRGQRMQDERDGRERRDSRRRGRWNTLLGLGGAAIGFGLGGPGGAAAGFNIGSRAGGR